MRLEASGVGVGAGVVASGAVTSGAVTSVVVPSGGSASVVGKDGAGVACGVAGVVVPVVPEVLAVRVAQSPEVRSGLA